MKISKDHDMLIGELAFAQRQVDAGQTALQDENIDPKVLTRVAAAVKYWGTRCTTIQQEIDQMENELDTIEQGFTENL